MSVDMMDQKVKELPDIAARFMKQNTVRRFVLA